MSNLSLFQHQNKFKREFILHNNFNITTIKDTDIKMFKSRQIFLIFGFLLTASFAFTINWEHSIESDGSVKPVDQFLNENLQVSNCSTKRVNQVYVAVSGCYKNSSYSIADCIHENLFNNTGEKWDVFVKDSSSTADVAYWYYTNCSIILTNYGPGNRTFKIWSAVSYKNVSLFKEPQSSVDQQYRDNGKCSITRVTSVQNSISNCQMNDTAQSAACIQDRIQSNLTEYWDVSIAKNTGDNAALYWYFDDCSLVYKNYGSLNRTYTAWKAQ